MTERSAHLVVDLGFGDAGKGHLVDWLVRRSGAPLVVRYNGGAQAGHTVVTDDGRAHTFAQIGAGSFVAGVRTFLAAPFVIHPTALAVEAERLGGCGVPDALARLAADARCRVITPYHQALNRLRELARGEARHGSCGVGVGETVADSLAHPDQTITLLTLRDPARARRLLERVRERKRAEAGALGGDGPAWADELRAFDHGVADAWLERASAVASALTLVGPGALPPGAERGDVVFEGAQGVLLDHAHGFPPYTTWSDCTLGGADHVLDAWRWSGARRRLGVLRSYHVRHGAGPLPTETAALDLLPEPHNAHGPWQGRFRRGWLDLPLAARAAAAVAPLDGIALTHLDALPLVRPWRVAVDHGPQGPVLREVEDARDLIAALEGPLGRKVILASTGPRSGNVTEIAGTRPGRRSRPARGATSGRDGPPGSRW